LRDFNAPLATECLALAQKAYAEEKARPAAPAPEAGPGAVFGRTAELAAVMQLMTATREKQHVDRFKELVWPALERNAAMTLQLAARAIPVMDAAYATKLRP
jgi:hypothetical protein